MFSWCNKLESLKLDNWDLSKNPNMGWFISKTPSLKSISMSGWKIPQSFTHVIWRVWGYPNDSIEEIDVSGWDLSKTEDLNWLFWDMRALKTIKWLNTWNTSKVTNMGQMFYGCSSLTWLDLSNFDTSNVINMWFGNGWIFRWCNKLEELNLSGWDFKGVSNNQLMMYVMWWTPQSLKKLNMTNTKYTWNATYAFGWLDKLEELNLNWADTRGVINMTAMFNWDSKLKDLDLSSFDTSNVTNMSTMFYWCSSLTSLDLSNWNTNNLTNMGQMFYGCSSLTWLDLSNFDTSNVINMWFGNGWIFWWCNKLEELNLSGWDFKGVSNNQLMVSVMWWTPPQSLKKLNMTNTKYTWNASYAFGWLNKLEYLNLNWADTSNVVNMNSMFSWCSSLTWLDLGWLNTEKVMTMEKMFNGCSKLENLNLDNRVINNSSSTIGWMFGWASNLKNVSMRNWTIPETFTHAIWCRTSSLCSTSLESIDVSNWDLSKTKDLNWLFGDSKVKEIKWLDTWDTSGVTNMYSLFYNCNNLTRLDLSSFDTSNVTTMYTMFYGCSSLTWLDLSNFDTSNVMANNMQAMFNGCSKLENLNLDNWVITGNSNTIGWMFGWANNLKTVSMRNWTIPETFTHAIWCRASSLCATWLESIDVSNWNLNEARNLQWLFWYFYGSEIKWLDTWNTIGIIDMSDMFDGCSNLSELDLSNWDTSNVTDMNHMFQNCSNLTWLDLSNFDTSNVTNMYSMFYNTPNLKTIYASDKFVTTALSWDTSSKDMFSWTISVIWWNGTKFDPNHIDKTYAKIDKVWQTWYFTDKNAINVKFINTLDWTETTSTFAKWQKLTPPSVNGYHVAWWYLDEEMIQAIDLNKWVDTYTVIYVKYDRNGSSGWWGGGWSSKKTDEDTHWSAEDSQKNTQDDKNTENVIQSDPEHSEWGSEESSNTPIDSSDKSSEWQEILSPSDSSFTKEQKDAYTFAKENWITTKDTIQSAQMNGKLTRIAMAKMLSQYAMNVLWQTPDTSKTIKFRDVTSKKDADYDNWVTLAYQLWIMWQNMPNNRFRPNDEVSRAEFVTALSRLLYQTTDGEYKSTSKYYTPHMAKLYNEWIINNTDPSMAERRWYVMIMLMRSSK